MDGRIMCCDIISSCQSAATSEIAKGLLSICSLWSNAMSGTRVFYPLDAQFCLIGPDQFSGVETEQVRSDPKGEHPGMLQRAAGFLYAWCPPVTQPTASQHYCVRVKSFPRPMRRRWSPFFIPQPDTHLHRETTDTELLYCVVCLLTYQHLLPTHGGMARLSWPGWLVIYFIDRDQCITTKPVYLMRIIIIHEQSVV